ISRDTVVGDRAVDIVRPLVIREDLGTITRDDGKDTGPGVEKPKRPARSRPAVRNTTSIVLLIGAYVLHEHEGVAGPVGDLGERHMGFVVEAAWNRVILRVLWRGIACIRGGKESPDPQVITTSHNKSAWIAAVPIAGTPSRSREILPRLAVIDSDVHGDILLR